MAALKQAGFTLEELGDLSPQAWIDLYGAVMFDRYIHLSSLVGVAHPKNPLETQRRFLRAAKAAMDAGRPGKPPIWTDPKRFRRLLHGVPGIEIKESGTSQPPAGEAPGEAPGGPLEGSGEDHAEAGGSEGGSQEAPQDGAGVPSEGTQTPSQET